MDRERVRAGFFHAFPAEVNGVASALIIRFDQERLRFAFASLVVLAPDKCVRPVAIVSEREIVNDRRGRAMPFQVGLERFGAFDVTVRNLQRQILRRVPGNPAAE